VIEEEALVMVVEPGYAWVETSRRSACGSCSASSGCGTSVVAKLFDARVNRLRVTDCIGVEVGDRVVIGIADSVLTQASLLAYLMPLIALMLSAFAAQSAGLGEEISALIGLLGLCGGLWVTGRVAGGAVGGDRFRPVLLRKALTAKVISENEYTDPITAWATSCPPYKR